MKCSYRSFLNLVLILLEIQFFLICCGSSLHYEKTKLNDITGSTNKVWKKGHMKIDQAKTFRFRSKLNNNPRQANNTWMNSEIHPLSNENTIGQFSPYKFETSKIQQSYRLPSVKKVQMKSNDLIVHEGEPRTGLILLSTVGLIEAVIVAAGTLGLGGAFVTIFLLLTQFLVKALFVFFTGVYLL